MKIFIYLPNWLGDAAMAAPCINLLTGRFANAHIFLYGAGGSLALFEGYGTPLKELRHRRLRQFLALRKSHKFDLVLNLKASISSRFLCRLLRARRKIFFAPLHHAQIHQVAKYANTLKPLGIDVSALSERSSAEFIYLPSAKGKPSAQPQAIYELFKNSIEAGGENFRKFAVLEKLPSKSAAAVLATNAQPLTAQSAMQQAKNAQRLLANRFKPQREKSCLAIAVGAAYGAAKCYEDFADLALLLAPHFRRILLLGSAAEMPAAQGLERVLRTRAKVSNLCGKTDIRRLCAAIDCSSLVLANDSGVMHLCAMRARRCAVVFGPTNPAQTAAYSASALIFSTLLDCAGCGARSCPKKHHECMKLARAQDIYEQIRARWL